MQFQPRASWVNHYTAVANEDQVLEDCPGLLFGPPPPSTFPLLTLLQKPCPYLFFLDASNLFQSLDFVLAVPCVWNDPTLDLHMAYPFTFSGLASSITFAQKLSRASFRGGATATLSTSLLFGPIPPPPSLCPALTSILALYSFLFVIFLLFVLRIQFQVPRGLGFGLSHVLRIYRN